MKKALSLAKLYIDSLYGINGFISDLKHNKKSAAKKIGIIVLILFSLSTFVVSMAITNIQLYDALSPVKQQGLVVYNAIISAVLMTIVFGIIGVISTYFLNNEGDIILSMPLKGWQLLFAKIATSYLGELLISIFIMSIGCIVYGVKSGAGIIFYISYILVTLIIPIIPLVIVYFIVVPLMKFGNFLKKKDMVMIISGFFGFAIAMGYQYFIQKIMNTITNKGDIAALVTSPNSILNIAGKVYYPSIWATNSILNLFSIKGIIGLILLIAISLLSVYLLLMLMDKLYMASIIGSGEVRKSSRKMNEGQFKTKVRRKSKISSLINREIKLMNREPVFFLNGPFAMILLPVILGISFALQGTSKEIVGLKDQMNMAYYIKIAITSAICAFIASTTSIAPTCISREGKAFSFIKSLPIDAEDYLMAKFYHAFIFSLIGNLIGCAAGAFVLGLGAIGFVVAYMIAVLIEIPFIFLGIFFELKWPHLNWDNPQKAIKQNVNAVIVILIQMFGLPGIIALLLYTIKNVLVVYLLLIVVPLIIDYYSYTLVMNYGKKRFYIIEE